MDLKIKILSNIQFSYVHNSNFIKKAIDDKTDINILEPDGINIAYILSNFGSKYHSNYEHLSLENIEKEKERNKISNKGRKKKEKIKKINKRNNGADNKFPSCIEFGIICPNNNKKVHRSKIFSSNSGSIPGFSQNNNEYILELINILITFININLPGRNLKFISYKSILCNIYTKFKLPKSINKEIEYRFNFYNLKKYIDNDNYNNKLLAVNNYNKVEYQHGESCHLIINIYKIRKTINKIIIKVYSNGKVNLNGGNNEVINKKYIVTLAEIFNDIIINHLDDVIQISYPTRKQKEIVHTDNQYNKIYLDDNNKLQILI